MLINRSCRYHLLLLILAVYMATNVVKNQSFRTRQLKRQLRWFSQRRSRTPHFYGVHTRGLWPPNSNSGDIFVQCTYPQVSSSYVYLFGSYRVDKHTHKETHKQTDTAENIQRSSLRRWVNSLMTGLTVSTQQHTSTTVNQTDKQRNRNTALLSLRLRS